MGPEASDFCVVHLSDYVCTYIHLGWGIIHPVDLVKAIFLDDVEHFCSDVYHVLIVPTKCMLEVGNMSGLE